MKFALSLFLLLPLFAQRVPTWPTAPANCGLDGQVINSLTQQPVSGAVVTIYNKHAFRTRDGNVAITDTTIRPPENAPQDNPQSVTADDYGRFSFGGVEPGIYVLAAMKEGYVRTPYNPVNPVSSGTIQLEPGAVAHGLVIRLMPQSLLAGRVNSKGEAVRGARVTLLQEMVGPDGPTLFAHASTVTNGRGEYGFQRLEPGKYYLQAVPPPADPLHKAGPQHLIVFYPGSLARSGAQSVALLEGQHQDGLDIEMPKGRASSVVGAIEATEGARPILVEAISREFGQIPGVIMQGKDGRFDFEVAGLSPGPYILHAVSGRSGLQHEAWMPVNVELSGSSDITLRPGPPVELHGRVRAEGLPGVRLSGMQLALDNSYSVNGEGIRIPVQEDGTFTLKDVRAAVYRITPKYTFSGYLQAVRLGGVDITETGLDLREGAPSGDVELVINPAGGALLGRVMDENGKGSAGALIALLPVERPTDPQRIRELSRLTYPNRRATTDLSGSPPASTGFWRGSMAP